jgi:Ca-activated chloride channel family protein
VHLQGFVNGQPANYTFPDIHFREEGGEAFIPRLWATRKIGHLLTQVRLYGAERELVDEIVRLGLEYGIVTPYTSFLVDEAEDALGADGKRLLAPGARGTATPSGASMPARASGRAAVESSMAQRTLREAEVVQAPAGERVRSVGSKTFVLRGGTWVDTTYEDTMETIDVPFASSTYFAFVRDHPTWGPYLALGDRVLLVWQGRAYRIGPKESADGTSNTFAEPTASSTPSPTSTERVRPTRTPRPTATLDSPAQGFWVSFGKWLKGMLAENSR